MSSNKMDVKITLTPLGQDEKQNHRTIAITRDNPSASVGRASKNNSKGLLATPNNAWFDYPILSRTHAKFTASLVERVIYLQDCGSTHGTYIDKKRLEAAVNYALADGEVITFGQRVTSGAVTYPAKKFRIHSKWEAPSEVQDSYSTTILRNQRLAHTASSSRPAFTSDFDHSSESSREGSVQIVESHRHTFSVPSSDYDVDSEDEEDEVQIASSVQGGEEEDSASTTPDRQAVEKAHNTEGEAQSSVTGPAPGEVRGLNLKGPTLQDILTETAKDGTSQENPINLEGVCTSVIDVDTESEDDNGPDILPFYESLKADRLDQEKGFYEPQVARQTPPVTLPTTTTAAEKQSDRDLETLIHRIVPETQVKVANTGEARGYGYDPTRVLAESTAGARGYDPTRVLAESTAGATDDFSSEDDDGFDYDHGFFDEDFEPFREPSILVEMPSSCNPKVTIQSGSEDSHCKTLTPSLDETGPTRLSHISVSSDAIDVSQPSEPSLVQAQRAPSPSDAALAKKANDPKTRSSRDIGYQFPKAKWPPAAKTTYSRSTEHFLDNPASREERIGAYSWPELQSPEPRSYDQGPFSSQPKIVIPAARSPEPERVKDQPKKATVTWAEPCEENDDMTMNIDRSARTGKQASKITIPSLVENYLAENPRPLKRRHGEINESHDVGTTSNVPTSTSPVTCTSGYKRTFAESSYEEALPGTTQQSHVDHTDCTCDSGEDKTTQYQLGLVDRDSLLNDAQPRENIFQTDTASLSQDSVSEPALGSVSITTTVQDDGMEGPAPKKARTSSSSSGGIGKFVMGVGFGLLGAAAAFVATIPASVYEEALREFNNAT